MRGNRLIRKAEMPAKKHPQRQPRVMSWMKRYEEYSNSGNQEEVIAVFDASKLGQPSSLQPCKTVIHGLKAKEFKQKKFKILLPGIQAIQSYFFTELINPFYLLAQLDKPNISERKDWLRYALMPIEEIQQPFNCSWSQGFNEEQIHQFVLRAMLLKFAKTTRWLELTDSWFRCEFTFKQTVNAIVEFLDFDRMKSIIRWASMEEMMRSLRHPAMIYGKQFSEVCKELQNQPCQLFELVERICIKVQELVLAKSQVKQQIKLQ